MSGKQHLEQLALEQFAFLQNQGFPNRTIEREDYSTKIRYSDATKTIAVEVSLDWRDLVTCVFIVRLSNGQPPKGYYVADGKACRIYLEEAIRMFTWSVPGDAWSRLKPARRRIRDVTPELLQASLKDLATVLSSVTDNIRSVGVAMFDRRPVQ